jgi:putative endonuclease
MYFTYILISESTNKLYIGQTNNLEDRLFRHNKGLNKYTKGKGPWEILYCKSFTNRKEAVALELKLKSFKNRAYILSWVSNNL